MDLGQKNDPKVWGGIAILTPSIANLMQLFNAGWFQVFGMNEI